MKHRWDTMSSIAGEAVIAIVRQGSASAAQEHAARLLAAGLTVVEVSLTTPGALEVVADLTGRGDAVVGVGTVLDAESAVAAARAGASFVVTPAFDPGTIRAAHRHGLAAIVGAGTATEVLSAMEHGADAVKLFPASGSSPAVLAALLEPLPHAPLVPTGGVRLDEVGAWLGAGAVAVALGASLVSGDADTRALVSRLREQVGQARAR